MPKQAADKQNRKTWWKERKTSNKKKPTPAQHKDCPKTIPKRQSAVSTDKNLLTIETEKILLPERQTKCQLEAIACENLHKSTAC
jgi:hypothetical protein